MITVILNKHVVHQTMEPIVDVELVSFDFYRLFFRIISLRKIKKERIHSHTHTWLVFEIWVKINLFISSQMKTVKQLIFHHQQIIRVDWKYPIGLLKLMLLNNNKPKSNECKIMIISLRRHRRQIHTKEKNDADQNVIKKQNNHNICRD